MPLSKAKRRAYDQRRKQVQKRAVGAYFLSKADVRAMRRAGLRIEELEGESGTAVSFQAFSALMRDRDAIKTHLEWHHDSIKNPDVATIIERVSRERSTVVEKRILQLEADFSRLEAMLESLVRQAEEWSS